MDQIYKVLIIDDEVDSFCNDEKVKKCRQERVELIKAHNISEFEAYLRNCDGYVDAIITDVNFSAGDDGVAADDNDSSGFNKVQQIVEIYRSRGRYIPYYICSGKPELVKDRYLKYNELKELETNGRIFNKEEFWDLIEKIKTEAVVLQSSAFRLRKLYSSELKATKNCISSSHEKLLLEILIYCEEGNYDYQQTIGYFTPLRKIIEIIRDKCEDLHIIPPAVSSINDFSRFLQGLVVNGYNLNEGEIIMPKALARCLYFYLDITQDASHSKKDLKLYVEDYVRSQRNVILLKSIVNIALDICLWFNKYYLENLDVAANEAKWNNELYRGKAVLAYSLNDNKPITVCGPYSISKAYLDKEVIIYGPTTEPRIEKCYCNSQIVKIIGHATNVKLLKD